MKIKQKALEEEFSKLHLQCVKETKELGKATYITHGKRCEALGRLDEYNKILAEVSKCKICGKKSDFDLLSVECPDCYLKGCKNELEKQKVEVGKVIDEYFKDYDEDTAKELKQKLGIK